MHRRLCYPLRSFSNTSSSTDESFKDHYASLSRLQKPLVLSESGKRVPLNSTRAFCTL